MDKQFEVNQEIYNSLVAAYGVADTLKAIREVKAQRGIKHEPNPDMSSELKMFHDETKLEAIQAYTYAIQSILENSSYDEEYKLPARWRVLDERSCDSIFVLLNDINDKLTELLS